MAKAYGYIIVYNNNGDIVYQHKGSGGDYGGTVSLNNNIVTISSDYAPQVEPIDDSDPEFPDAFPTVIDTGEVNVSNLTNPTSLQIVLPYKASKIRYFSGNSGNFADSAGSDYADVIINNGETITLASNNYSSGGGCAIQYYEPQPTLTFKHFYDAGTIGTGTVKFRHYSQQAQLATPQNVAASGTTVSWGAVENATSYEILVNNSSFSAVSTTSVDLSTLAGWEALNYNIHAVTIIAKADGYRDSEPSKPAFVEKRASFVQIFPTTTPDNYTLFDNLNQSKVYTVLIPDNVQYPRTLTYSNGSWEAKDMIIISQTSNSVKAVVDGRIGYFINYVSGITLEGPYTADFSYLDKFSTAQVYAFWLCLIEGTLITLADGTKKPIEQITYDDELLVWNFYEGKFDTAKPCWIKIPQVANEYNLCKFSNGAEVGFVGEGGNKGYHRIYNDEAKCFTHTGVAETPIGTTTFAEDMSMPTLVEQEVVKEEVKYYNIITDKHYNLFANGILTSCKLSNKYAIENMKYVGEQLITDEEERAYFERIEDIKR